MKSNKIQYTDDTLYHASSAQELHDVVCIDTHGIDHAKQPGKSNIQCSPYKPITQGNNERVQYLQQLILKALRAKTSV